MSTTPFSSTAWAKENSSPAVVVTVKSGTRWPSSASFSAKAEARGSMSSSESMMASILFTNHHSFPFFVSIIQVSSTASQTRGQSSASKYRFSSGSHSAWNRRYISSPRARSRASWVSGAVRKNSRKP